MEGHKQLHAVFLDEAAFTRWNSIKTAEEVATDTQVANLLLKQYDKTHEDHWSSSAVYCSQCNSPYQLPLLCRKCQSVSEHSHPVPASQRTAPCENQTPVVYRLLHISAKDGAETENEKDTSSNDIAVSLPPNSSMEESNQEDIQSCDPRLTLTLNAEDVCDAGKSIIIVDYFSKQENEVHEMCPEGYIFTSIRHANNVTGEDGLRVAVDVPTSEEPVSLENAELQSIPMADAGTVVDASTVTYSSIVTGSDLQLGNVVCVSQTPEVGDHWIEQLLYGDGTTQLIQRHKDAETATAVAALEALSSDLPAVQTQNLEVLPRRGKDVPPSRIRICRLCGRQCTSPAELKRHMMLHTGEKPFVCDECGAAFNQTGNLKKHKIDNHSSRTQFCPKCGVRFALVEDLRQHMRFHSSDRQHVCGVCNRAYRTARDLRIHKKTHASNRPWKCVECGATFPSKKKLAIHKSTHTGEKVFPCKDCEAIFFDHEELKDHRWNMHRSTRKTDKEACHASLAALP